jgi:hypothetical protein
MPFLNFFRLSWLAFSLVCLPLICVASQKTVLADCNNCNTAMPQAKWHSVPMPVRTNLPSIHFYNKINPVWWFGNADEPRAPAWYRPGSRFRNVAWYVRNPLANFSNYVIGIGDKASVRSGRYPTKISNPNGGWNYAVSRRHILYLPLIDYKRGRFEFYFGWRERGNFGIKLNFRQAPPRPKKQAAPAPAPSGSDAQNTRTALAIPQSGLMVKEADETQAGSKINPPSSDAR